MKNLVSKVSAFIREEEGLTMIEYAIGAAVIAGAAIAIFNSLGGGVSTQATATSDVIKGAQFNQ